MPEQSRRSAMQTLQAEPTIPHAQNAAMIAKVCRHIERSEQAPSLEQLAAYAGMSRFHFHRVFKAVTGLTPNEYAAARRTKRVRATLERSETVTDAIYDAGFNANSRFYESSNAVLGMTPSTFLKSRQHRHQYSVRNR